LNIISWRLELEDSLSPSFNSWSILCGMTIQIKRKYRVGSVVEV